MNCNNIAKHTGCKVGTTAQGSGEGIVGVLIWAYLVLAQPTNANDMRGTRRLFHLRDDSLLSGKTSEKFLSFARNVSTLECDFNILTTSTCTHPIRLPRRRTRPAIFFSSSALCVCAGDILMIWISLYYANFHSFVQKSATKTSLIPSSIGCVRLR